MKYPTLSAVIAGSIVCLSTSSILAHDNYICIANASSSSFKITGSTGWDGGVGYKHSKDALSEGKTIPANSSKNWGSYCGWAQGTNVFKGGQEITITLADEAVAGKTITFTFNNPAAGPKSLKGVSKPEGFSVNWIDVGGSDVYRHAILICNTNTNDDNSKCHL